MKAMRILVLGAATVCSAAFAMPAAAQQRRVDTVEYVGPDRTLLRTGIWTLGLSYVPALVVAIESPLPADRYLYAPVAGPWLDLAHRECNTCRQETLNKVLLVTDGIIQGIGSLEIVGSLLFIERATMSAEAQRPRTVAAKSDRKSDFRIGLSPRKMAGGYGLAAVGTF